MDILSSSLRHLSVLCGSVVKHSWYWGSPQGRRGHRGSAEKTKAGHSSILPLICTTLLAGFLPVSSFHVSRVTAAQTRESENSMAAAKFPKLVQEYLQDLH